jgi:parallel beta-helix repeat protein
MGIAQWHVMGFVFSVGLALTSHPLTLEAAETGKAVNTTSGKAYSKLDTALKDAQAGDQIEIGSGTYKGSFGINKPITLTGVDTGEGPPVIDGNGKTVVLNLNATGIWIEGIKITSTSSPKRPFGFLTPYAEEACILVEKDDIQIVGNTLTGCGQGIYVRNTDGALIENNVVTENHIGGIFFLNSHKAKVAGNTVTDNGYYGVTVQSFSFLPGIKYSYMAGKLVGKWWHVTDESRNMADIMSEDIEISENTISRNWGGGILVGFARRISALKNTIEENGGAPPSEIDMAWYNKHSKTKLETNGRGFGILLSCDAYENKLENNEVNRNVDHGIQVTAAVLNDILGNSVSDNDYGIRIQGSFGNVIRENKVSGSVARGISLEVMRIPGIMDIPSIANRILGNDLANPGENSFDDSHGRDQTPEKAWFDVAKIKRLPDYPAPEDRINLWDDGAKGNHYSDFDDMEEGFTDRDGNGVGETPHAIPGGSAVDHFPLVGSDRAKAPSQREGNVTNACGASYSDCSRAETRLVPCPAG